MKRHSLESSNVPLRVAFLLCVGFVLYLRVGEFVGPLLKRRCEHA